MGFASNPREFDSRGIPKFGAELSDDDEGIQSAFIEDEPAPVGIPAQGIHSQRSFYA